ncbi:MAG: FprA family A-type flavoprotein [Deltaproteobacteria bacterium]|nr:MAG: FprA family A-type flavoprotein [Deltaproteobacteria bacterium]
MLQIMPGIDWVGVRHADLEIFDELFPTHNGTTYNAYLVRGRDKTALIDTVKEPFTDELLAKLEAAGGLDKIDLVVVNHTEPDHSGALRHLLARRPDLPVYCTKPAQNFLAQLLNAPFNAQVVSDGQELDLGGRTLRFIVAPYLHWPDTMFTYLVEDAVLFPCDAFGAHYCAQRLFDDEIPDFSKDFHFYFDCIMRPFKDKVREAVAKVESLPLKMICPSHGPVHRRNPQAVIDTYRRLATQPPASIGPRALMLTLSSHGNTRQMAAAVREGVESQGFEVIEMRLCELRDSDLRDELELADLVLVGTATINRDAPPQVWHALSLFSLVTPRAKVAAAFGSFGWSGEAVKLVEERLKGLRFKLGVPGLTLRFKPTEEDLAACRKFGVEAAQSVSA